MENVAPLVVEEEDDNKKTKNLSKKSPLNS